MRRNEVKVIPILVNNLKEQVVEILIDLGLVTSEEVSLNDDYSIYIRKILPEQEEIILV